MDVAVEQPNLIAVKPLNAGQHYLPLDECTDGNLKSSLPQIIARSSESNIHLALNENGSSHSALDKNVNSQSDKSIPKCQMCGREFTPNYPKYIKEGKMICPYHCSVCGKGHRDKTSWRRHAYFHIHQMGNDSESISKVREDLKNQGDIGPALCNVCGKEFSNINCVRQHMLAHSTIRPFECIFCPKKFKLEAYLRKHLRSTHSGIQVILDNNVTPMPGHQNESNLNEQGVENTEKIRAEASTPQAETFTSKAKAFTPQAETLTHKAEPFTPQVETFIPATHTFTPGAEAFTLQAETFTHQVKALIPQAEAFTPQGEAFSQAKAFTPQAEAFTSQAKALTPQANAFTQVEAFTPQAKSFTSQTEAMTSQANAFTNQAETFTSQAKAFTLQAEAFPPQAKEFHPQVETSTPYSASTSYLTIRSGNPIVSEHSVGVPKSKDNFGLKVDGRVEPTAEYVIITPPSNSSISEQLSVSNSNTAGNILVPINKDDENASYFLLLAPVNPSTGGDTINNQSDMVKYAPVGQNVDNYSLAPPSNPSVSDHYLGIFNTVNDLQSSLHTNQSICNKSMSDNSEVNPLTSTNIQEKQSEVCHQSSDDSCQDVEIISVHNVDSPSSQVIDLESSNEKFHGNQEEENCLSSGLRIEEIFSKAHDYYNDNEILNKEVESDRLGILYTYLTQSKKEEIRMQAQLFDAEGFYQKEKPPAPIQSEIKHFSAESLLQERLYIVKEDLASSSLSDCSTNQISIPLKEENTKVYNLSLFMEDSEPTEDDRELSFLEMKTVMDWMD